MTFPTFVLAGSSPERVGGEHALRARELAGVVLDRARAISDFADRHPRLAFEAGIEPISVEMRLALATGGLDRLSGGARLGDARDLATLDRASRLQSEAARRLAQYEEAALEASRPSLGRVIETALAFATNAVVMVSALA